MLKFNSPKFHGPTSRRIFLLVTRVTGWGPGKVVELRMDGEGLPINSASTHFHPLGGPEFG